MRILQWNCNLALKKKIQAIEHINAEIMVFQECENAEEDFFDGYRFFWTGRNDNKGLGVLIKDTSARLHASFQSNFIYFLPIETDEFNILAVWAFNHRAAKFGDGIIELQECLSSRNWRHFRTGSHSNPLSYQAEI